MPSRRKVPRTHGAPRLSAESQSLIRARLKRSPGKSLERGCTSAEWSRPLSDSILLQRRDRNPRTTGMPQETPPLRTAFVKSYDRPSTLLVRTLAPGRAIVTALADMCSSDTPSVWCTSFAAMTSRLSPWPTDGGDLATGGRVSEMPSKLRMQRSALPAAAAPAPSAEARVG